MSDIRLAKMKIIVSVDDPAMTSQDLELIEDKMRRAMAQVRAQARAILVAAVAGNRSVKVEFAP